ncbi:MAG: xanthine dehydrogenase family protein subunit M [Thermodesulfobacteriota bacterium]|nr:xanthine dehydrogenase family protein subunit M [Thermodesulfobacteriota bacterium]
MRLRRFEFFNPSSLLEVFDLLARYGKDVRLIAGGTDLLVQMKQKLVLPQKLINLLTLAGLRGIERDGDSLRIGALARHADIERSTLLKDGWKLLALAAHKIGSPQIRHLGTLGGNLCNGSPSADTASPLLVLKAQVCLASGRGERRLPLESFFTGPGETVLEKDEVLKEVIVPKPPVNSSFSYLKLGRRKSMDLALVSAAVLLTVDPGRGSFEEVRIALGSVSPTPIRIKETEMVLEGKPVDEDMILQAAGLAQKECQPISDIRASAEYRKEMVKVLVERAIKAALGLPIPPTGI